MENLLTNGLNAASGLGNLTNGLGDLTNAANTAANNASSITNAATKVIQDKPLEDSVREALLKVIVNPKFSEQIESDIATVFRPILKMQLEKVGKIIANADEAKTSEEAKAVETEINTVIAEGSVAEEGSDTKGSVAEEGSDAKGSVAEEGSDAKGSVAKELEGGSKCKNRNKSRKSLKKSASRGRRTTRRHKRTSR